MQITGLVLNIVGATLVFFFGFPQPHFQESVGIAVTDNTPVGGGITAKEYAAKVRRKKLIYKRMATLALTLMLVGFILQLGALLTDQK